MVLPSVSIAERVVNENDTLKKLPYFMYFTSGSFTYSETVAVLC